MREACRLVREADGPSQVTPHKLPKRGGSEKYPSKRVSGNTKCHSRQFAPNQTNRSDSAILVRVSTCRLTETKSSHSPRSAEALAPRFSIGENVAPAMAACFGNGKTYEQAKRLTYTPRRRRYTQRLDSPINWGSRVSTSDIASPSSKHYRRLRLWLCRKKNRFAPSARR